MPPMLPYGHDESELYKDFFDHSAHDVALRAASVVQLQCVRKFKNLKRLQKQFPNNTLPWWELGGAEDFENVSAWKLWRHGFMVAPCFLTPWRCCCTRPLGEALRTRDASHRKYLPTAASSAHRTWRSETWATKPGRFFPQPLWFDCLAACSTTLIFQFPRHFSAGRTHSARFELVVLHVLFPCVTSHDMSFWIQGPYFSRGMGPVDCGVRCCAQK